MTQQQYRLRGAGLLLMRAATLFGGAVGLILLLTVMTGNERIACAFAVGALAMPIVLVAILIKANRLDFLCLTGLAVMSAVGVINLDAYFALLTMALIGAGLVGGVTAVAAARRADRLG